MGKQNLGDVNLHLQLLQQSTAFVMMRQESFERSWSSLHDWDEHHELKVRNHGAVMDIPIHR